jgi:hypothetical protein
MSMNFDFVTEYYKEDVRMMCLDYSEELEEMYRWADDYYAQHGIRVHDTKEFGIIVNSLTKDIEEMSDSE